MLVDQGGGRAAVEIHQIEHDLHAQPVRAADEALEVVVGAVFRLDVIVIADAVGILRVVAAARLLAVAPELGVLIGIVYADGAEIDDIDPQLGEVGQQLGCGVQRALGREGAQEQLIDDALMRRGNDGALADELGHDRNTPL